MPSLIEAESKPDREHLVLYVIDGRRLDHKKATVIGLTTVVVRGL